MLAQRVTISGPPGVVIYSGHTVTVNAPLATVVLRGLTIDGNGATGSGIEVQSVGLLVVESCEISAFSTGGGGRGDGIYLGSAGKLTVKDTIVRRCGSWGIEVAPMSGAATASVDHCRFEGNQFGLLASMNAAVTARDCVSSENFNVGFYASSGGELNLESCLSANNDFGIGSSGSGSLVRVSNSTVTDNVTMGLTTDTGGLLTSRTNNTLRGNGTNGSFTGTFGAD
jgi:hypothetical protein